MIEEILAVLKVNSAVEFMSPRMGQLKRRRLVVERIQDTAVDPLDPMVAERIPRSCQGRYILTGMDLDRGEQRSFAIEFISNVRAVAERVGKLNLYLLEEGSDPERIYVAECPREAAAYVEQWCNNPYGLTIAAAPAEADFLRKVG